MNDEKLNYLEAIFLVVIVMVTHIILEFPNVIIKNCGTSSLLNVLFITVLVLLFFKVVYNLFKPFEGNNILYVSEYVGGKKFRKITSLIYTIYLIFISSITLRHFCENLKVVYFPNANLVMLIGTFIITAIIVNKFGSKSIIKANTLLVPLILVTMIIIFVFSTKEASISRFLPILGNGFNQTFVKGMQNIYSFGGLIYLYLITSDLKNIQDYKKVGIASILLSAGYLLLSVASLLTLFPFLVNGSNVLSIYLSTRTIRLGKFLPRIDTIFMFTWIFNFLLYLSIIMYYIKKLNIETFGIKNKSIVLYLTAIIIFIISMMFQNSLQLNFLETKIYKYLALFMVFVYSPIILIVGYIKKNKEIKKQEIR